MSKKVLIAVHSNTWFVELFRFAKLLKTTEGYIPVMLFGNQYPNCLGDISNCVQEKIQTLNAYGEEIKDKTQEEIGAKEVFPVNLNERVHLSRMRSLIHVLIPKSLRVKFGEIIADPQINISLIKFLRQYFLFRARFNFIERILREQNPSILVLGGDNVGYDTSLYINLAHNKNTPVLIVPSTMSNGLEEAEAYFHNPEHNLGRWVNRFAAKLYPRWVFEHRGRKLLRVSGERVLLMEYFSLAPPLPWIFNSGFADAIAIESERMKKYYIDCGLPENQLRLIGSLADDVMVNIYKHREQYRTEVCRELGLKDDKPMLLSALPSDFLYMPGGRPECDFKTYPDLVSFWVQSIAAVKDHNILVCLHPSDKYEKFQYIESWGVKIARRNTAELVPLCDIYVASVSSTIRWAIACGIPVINYDVYRYRYTDYLGLAGVLIMEEQADFKTNLTKLTKDRNFFLEKKLAQESAAQNWGMFDGKVANRMTALLDEYAKQ